MIISRNCMLPVSEAIGDVPTYVVVTECDVWDQAHEIESFIREKGINTYGGCYHCNQNRYNINTSWDLSR